MLDVFHHSEAENTPTFVTANSEAIPQVGDCFTIRSDINKWDRKGFCLYLFSIAAKRFSRSLTFLIKSGTLLELASPRSHSLWGLAGNPA